MNRHITAIKKYQFALMLLLFSAQTEIFAADQTNAVALDTVEQEITLSSDQDLRQDTFWPVFDKRAVSIITKNQAVERQHVIHVDPSLSTGEDIIANGKTQDEQLYLDKKKEQEEEFTGEGHVFGYRNGFLHAALNLNAEWTDNLYNHKIDKKDNFSTILSPSVWLTWPVRRSRKPLHIAPNNTSPGGMQYIQTDYDVFNGYQAYLAGKINYTTYSENSELNHSNGSVEALLQY
ncbi:MAG: hypothetical protein D3923_06380, partial [Candidatus Electrothrix sp. AR3]|nr:hypothetical protein [Candidatus Electrothrix sp. AR3]